MLKSPAMSLISKRKFNDWKKHFFIDFHSLKIYYRVKIGIFLIGLKLECRVEIYQFNCRIYLNFWVDFLFHSDIFDFWVIVFINFCWNLAEIWTSQSSCVTEGRQGTGSVSRKIFSLQYSLEILRPTNLIPGTRPGYRIPDSRDDFSSRSRMKK